MNCQPPRWLIVVPIALAVWGIVSERMALLMLAVVVFVLVCFRPQRARRAHLASVPMGPDNAPAIGGMTIGKGEVGGTADDSC